MRCPNCAKFVSLDFSDPEVESIEVDHGGNVEIQVKLERTCADCGEVMKEATLEMTWEPGEDDSRKIKEHFGVNDPSLEIESTDVESIEKAGGRYKKSYFGAHVQFKITCGCADKLGHTTLEIDGDTEDEIAASGMDEVG
jgi:hypothetical protein